MNKKRLALVLLALTVIGLGMLVRYMAKSGDPFWVGAQWVFWIVVAVRLAIGVRRGLKLFRAQTAAEGVTLKSMDGLTVAAMPAWMRGYYAVEKKVYGGFWRALTRKPLAAAPGFSAVNGPRGPLVRALILLALALLLALPFGAPYVLPELRFGLLASLFACAPLLYALVWLVGMRRALRESRHSVSAEALVLDLGIRASAAIPSARIVRCGTLLVPFAQYRSMHQFDASEVWTVSPMETANVLVTLDAVLALDTLWFGYPKQVSTKYIALYVDEPHAFVDALSAVIPVDTSSTRLRA
jgi:hypothetical protein